jgi:hypothetical protein
LIDDGWKPFFKAFGLKLETLKAGEEEYDIYFFDALDKSACQIRNLDIHCIDGFFNAIKNIEQISYIQTLHLYCDLQKDFVFIRDLVVLKELVVDAYYSVHDDDLPQNQILFNEMIENAPPTLKSRSFELINHMIVEYKENSVPVNIEHLSFHTTVLPWNIDRLILMNFPCLRSLEINHCKVYGQTFNLITANLSCFTLRNISANEHAILVLTLGNNEKRWISPLRYDQSCGIGRKNKEFRYPPIRSTPTNDITATPSFTLICNSVENIYVTKK